jgi:hypothetical protein
VNSDRHAHAWTATVSSSDARRRKRTSLPDRKVIVGSSPRPTVRVGRNKLKPRAASQAHTVYVRFWPQPAKAQCHRLHLISLNYLTQKGQQSSRFFTFEFVSSQNCPQTCRQPGRVPACSKCAYALSSPRYSSTALSIIISSGAPSMVRWTKPVTKAREARLTSLIHRFTKASTHYI